MDRSWESMGYRGNTSPFSVFGLLPSLIIMPGSLNRLWRLMFSNTIWTPHRVRGQELAFRMQSTQVQHIISVFPSFLLSVLFFFLSYFNWSDKMNIHKNPDHSFKVITFKTIISRPQTTIGVNEQINTSAKVEPSLQWHKTPHSNELVVGPVHLADTTVVTRAQNLSITPCNGVCLCSSVALQDSVSLPDVQNEIKRYSERERKRRARHEKWKRMRCSDDVVRRGRLVTLEGNLHTNDDAGRMENSKLDSQHE